MADQYFIQYKVYITPLISDLTYGDEVEVTKYVDKTGVKKLKRSIDSGDYDVGVYTYGDITLKCFNIDGYFNDVEDRRSIFPYIRDRAKVLVKYIEIDKEDGSETATIAFRGLINEEATRFNPMDNSIRFKVLSRDSVIRNTKVVSQSVTNGMTTKNAILAILDNSTISSVLNISASNINPDLDIAIDDGSKFDNKKAKDALDQLMFISNSVLIIDESDNVIVKSRDHETDLDILNLYGPYDQYGRENIMSIKYYNTGMHRMFTSFKMDDIERSNVGIAAMYGERQKNLSNIEFITTDAKRIQIVNRLLDEFKAPKIELQVDVATRDVRDYDLLDRVSINYPLRMKPYSGKFMPTVGITEIGETTEPLPNIYGSFDIKPRVGFKIIGIDEDPKNFKSTLKLRQIGTELNDGVWDAPGSCILGFTYVDEGVICTGSTDPWNPSVVGAALIDSTRLE